MSLTLEEYQKIVDETSIYPHESEIIYPALGLCGEAGEVAEKIKKEMTMHGHTRVDNYYWMNQREDQKVLDYLSAENDYTSKSLAHTKELQGKIFDEIIGRIKKTDMSVPYREGAFYYYTRYTEETEVPIHF